MQLVTPSRNTSRLQTIPSPTGGLNVFDNLAQMPPSDAIRLDNLVPQPYGCTVRKGYRVHAEGIAGPVETLGGWFSRTGVSKLFAFGDHKFYDVTLPGTVGAPLLSGLLSNFWQSVGFANSAGSHTIFVDGVDDPIWYSALGVQRLTLGDGIANGTISGINPADFIQVTVHQRRLWFVPVNSTQGWFLPTNAVFGVAQAFDFGPHFKRGGYLSVLATWSVDAGQGSDDKLVAVSSNGEAAVFKGIDVTDPNSWTLVGIYFIGNPIRGRRYYTDIAGDLLFLTNIGIVSMSTVLVSTQVNSSNASIYSRKVQSLLSDLTTELHDIEGWELTFFPAINLMFINIPTIYSGANAQLVNNTITNAWCSFSGMDARTWLRFEGLPFFGDPDGRVIRAWHTDRDNVQVDGTGGTNINSSAQQAYTNLGSPTVQKQVGLYRCTFLLQQKIAYESKINYDYKPPIVLPPSGTAPSFAASLWGSAIWGTSLWGGGMLTQRDWRSANGIGEAVSIVLMTSTETETTWVGTDYTYRQGGPL